MAAVSVAAGAWVAVAGWVQLPGATRVPPGVFLVVAGAALLRRRPVAVGAAGLLLAVCLTQRSLAGLDGPVPSGRVEGTVTLVSDPRTTPGGGVRVEGTFRGRRVTLEAYRAPAATLRDRLAGERLLVIGDLRPPGPRERRALHRHLAGKLSVETVAGWLPGHGVTRAANRVRRALTAGAASLGPRQQSLLAGLTLGDTRDQPPDLTSAFRAAGLTHLSAISGQDVAIVLVSLSPVLARLRLAPRFLSTLGALAGFALVTRAEPSVLRATAMAAAGAYGAATGRPVTATRRLALAVTGVLVADPLLVTSLGFQLSVAGTLGIVLAARPLGQRLPGPRWLAGPVAVTAAAQTAVAPLLVASFGGMPLVALPANLVAGPPATLVKVWGLTAGLVAGAAGEPVATVLHLPTRALLTVFERTVTAAAAVPAGELRAGHLAVLGAGLGTAYGGRRLWRCRGLVRAAGAIAAAGSLAAAAVPAAVPAAVDGHHRLAPGVDLWRGGGAAVVAIDGRARDAWLAAELHGAGVQRVDVLVLRTPASRAVRVARSLIDRWPDLVVLVPPPIGGRSGGDEGVLDSALVPDPGAVVNAGTLRLTVDVDHDRLEVDVVAAGDAGGGAHARAPPACSKRSAPGNYSSGCADTCRWAPGAPPGGQRARSRRGRCRRADAQAPC